MKNETNYIDEELILSELLKEGVLFCNERHYSSNKDDKSEGETIVLFVNTNDVFAWGCADAEDLNISELPKLYDFWKNDNKWGVIKWVCKKRNEKPQEPVMKDMSKENSWENWMDDLKENQYDKIRKEKF